MNTGRTRTILSFLTLQMIYLCAVAHAGVTTDPVPREDAWWQERHQAVVERVKQGNVGALFIGDSITQGWEGPGKETWERYYAPRNVVNLGFSGDRTEHVLWRLDNGEIDGITPKVASIMIGTNNTPVAENTAEDIAAGIKAIVEKLRSRLPEMKILLLGVFPREEKPGELRAKIDQLNTIISGLHDGQNVFYLNIGATFTDPDGTLPKDIMPDFLHLSEAGYLRWAEAIEPYLAMLLGEMEFKPLLNGTDLAGWEAIGGDAASWGVENGMLYTTGTGEGGWLSTTSEYENFDLMLEFRVPPDGNSGVFIRAPREGNPAFAGSEIQVLDDAAPMYKDLKPWQYTGSIYSTEAPEKRVTRPAGEWQTMRIRAVGPKVRVYLNQHLIVEADLSQHPDKLLEHPGLSRTSGFIGLQNHGSRLDYRNIQIHVIK